MQITLKTSAAVPEQYILAHGPSRAQGNHVGPDSLEHDARVTVQVVETVRGTTATPKNRGNRVTSMSFSVTVICADVQAASTYALDYPKTLPREGTIWFKTELDNVSITRVLYDAVLQVVRARATGSSVTIFYSIQGGELGDEP